MKAKNRFEQRYVSGDLPWDVGRPDFNLTEIVETGLVKKCKTLEIGCGTGDNAIWLAKKKFEVTACDVSMTATQKAREKASSVEGNCNFHVIDFMKDSIPDLPFEFVFDRGCLHSFDKRRKQKKFSKKVASHLKNGGLWLSIIGNPDSGPRATGPPQHSAKKIISAVEPFFEILLLKSSHFDSDQPVPARAWVCLMRKRAGITC
jgi:SAM-dependent methyltransferase